MKSPEKIQELDFWDAIGAVLSEETAYEKKHIADFVSHMQRQDQLIRENPDWWPEGEADFKRCILGIVRDLIGATKETPNV